MEDLAGEMDGFVFYKTSAPSCLAVNFHVSFSIIISSI